MIVIKCDVCHMIEPLINPYAKFNVNFENQATCGDICENCWNELGLLIKKKSEVKQ